MKQERQLGALELRDVHFTYPARPDLKVLKGLSLLVEASRVVALVGPSGNGKSTVIGLVKRLYHASVPCPKSSYSHSVIRLFLLVLDLLLLLLLLLLFYLKYVEKEQF